jgi:hypothetical protein
MSYDLAVWEGQFPSNNAAAAADHARLMTRMEGGPKDPPSDRIRAYVDALLERWPDITDDRGENSPWADGPMIGNAFGNAIYFSMVWGQAEEASAFAASVAAQHRLVCFDPQWNSLRPAADERPPGGA